MQTGSHVHKAQSLQGEIVSMVYSKNLGFSLIFLAYMSKSGVDVCFTRTLVTGMYGPVVRAGVTRIGMAPTVARC